MNPLEIKGIELSRRYFMDAGLPLLRRHFPKLEMRVAAGLVAGGFEAGAGSEIGGFDDVISRDHNWGPRFFLFMDEVTRELYGAQVQRMFDRELPETFCGYELATTTLPEHRAYVVTPQENLRAVLGVETPSLSDVDWLCIPEARLFEYTAGEVFYEPVPLISPLRTAFAYYPDEVWFKRLSHAFFLMHLAGNVHRMAQRGDPVATRIYLDWLLQVVMRTVFLLKRRYAPYCKWLFRAFCELPDVPAELVESIRELSLQLDLNSVDAKVLSVLLRVGSMANQMGVIEPVPLRKESPFIWTDFNCYGFMYAFYDKLKGPLREKSPYEGPLDMAADGQLNHTTLKAAWETARPAKPTVSQQRGRNPGCQPQGGNS